MLFTDDVANMLGGAERGAWRREHVRRPQLARIIAGQELKVYSPKKNSPLIVWEVRNICASWVSETGECGSWEAAMEAAELHVEGLFRSAILALQTGRDSTDVP